MSDPSKKQNTKDKIITDLKERIDKQTEVIATKDKIITDLEEKIDKQTEAIARIERILTVNDRPIEERGMFPFASRHPHTKLRFPPELRKKASMNINVDPSLANVPQPEHLPTALSTLQEDVNAITAQLNSIHDRVYRISTDIEKLKGRKKKRASTTTESVKKYKPDSPDSMDNTR